MNAPKLKLLPSEKHGHSGHPQRPVQPLEPIPEPRSTPTQIEVRLATGDRVHLREGGWHEVLNVSDCSARVRPLTRNMVTVTDRLHDKTVTFSAPAHTFIISPKIWVEPGHHTRIARRRRVN